MAEPFYFYTDESGEIPRDVHSDPKDGNKRKNQQKTEDTNKARKIQENRAIYITNLPADTNEVEIEQVFKKYGIIDKGANGQPRIKMYKNQDGEFSRDALVVYFKRQSVDLAINMLDNYWFRIEDQTPGTEIRIKEADRTYKRNTDSDTIASKMSRQDRKAAERNRSELNRKLADWSDNEDELEEVVAPVKNKWAKVVILRNVYTLEELDKEPEAYLEIKDDMREAAEQHGKTTNVVLYDGEPDGVITVRFKDFEAAENFCKVTNGRSYAKRVLQATLAEDRPKFKRNKNDQGTKAGKAKKPEDSSGEENKEGN